MRSYMEQAARFERHDSRQKAWVHTKPPSDVAELILGRAGHWPFPAVRGVLAAPSLRPDGSILQQAGLRCRHRHVPDRRAGAAGDAAASNPGRRRSRTGAAREASGRVSPGRRRREGGGVQRADLAGGARRVADGATARDLGAGEGQRQELSVRPGRRDRDRFLLSGGGNRPRRGGTRETARCRGARRAADPVARQRQPAARRRLPVPAARPAAAQGTSARPVGRTADRAAPDRAGDRQQPDTHRRHHTPHRDRAHGRRDARSRGSGSSPTTRSAGSWPTAAVTWPPH